MKPLFVFLVVFFTLLSSIVKAETDYSSIKRKLQNRKAGLTSQLTHKKLERAFSFAKREKYAHAQEVLIELLKLTKNRPYEYAQIWQHLGFILAQKGEMPKAIKALENSLALESLPYQQTLSSLYTISQLYMALEKWNEAHATMSKWVGLAEVPTAESYIMMGSILSQLEKKESALQYVNEAIKMSEKPQEKWLQFALALNHELKNYDNALKLLVILTASFPQNDKYWKQMASTYLSMNQDLKALTTMELAYKMNFIKDEKELLNLASLYIYLDMPIKGAMLIENEIKNQRIKPDVKNLELLSQAWLQAREFKQGLLALKSAAELAPQGELHARVGFLMLEKEEWSEAEKFLQAGIKKGSLKKPEKVHLAMGIARYNQKNKEGALSALYHARKLANEDKSINQWIEQIKMEQVALNENSTSI